MAETIRLTTVEMFVPEAQSRSQLTNWKMAFLMGDILGRGQLRLCRGLRTGAITYGTVPEELDQVILGAMRNRYQLSDQTDMREFYIQQQKHAVGVIEHFGRMLPDIATDIELKDEVSLLSDNPHDLFRLLSMPPDKIDSVLAYETLRHALLSDIAGMSHARAKNGRVRSILSQLHRLFNEKLFTGLEGAGSQYMLKSYHDNKTNEVVGFPGEIRRPLTAHLKTMPLIVRQVPGIGAVYTSPRKKEDETVIRKSLAKAQIGDGIIRVENDVKDPIGMLCVLMDDQVEPAKLANLMVSVIQSDPKLTVEQITEINSCGCARGQSPETNFNARLQIWFANVSVPVELIFYDRQTYLNSRLEVGTRDSHTGLYQGRAHPLYEYRRDLPVAHILFPDTRYPVDIDEAFIRSSIREVKKLRTMGLNSL